MKRYIQAAVRNLADESYESLLQIAHINTDPRVLAQLSTCPGYVQVLVAGNPNTPQDILDRLAHSEHQAIRSAACANPSASASAKAFALTEWKASGLVDFTLSGYFNYEISDDTAYRKLDCTIRDFVAWVSGVQYLGGTFESRVDEDDDGNEIFLKEISFNLQFDKDPNRNRVIAQFRDALYDRLELELPEFTIWDSYWEVLLAR